jgi:hypothetical protein
VAVDASFNSATKIKRTHLADGRRAVDVAHLSLTRAAVARRPKATAAQENPSVASRVRRHTGTSTSAANHHYANDYGKEDIATIAL